MRILLIVFLFFSITNLVCGTLPKSVSQIIEGKSLKEQVKLLDSIAIVYRNKNLPLSILISNYSLRLAKENNFLKPIVRIYLTLSRTYKTQGIYDTAFLYIDSAKTHAFLNKISAQYANVFDYEGLIYMRLSNYQKATDCFYTCINYAEKENDSLKIHDGFEHLGSVAFYRKDYKNAIKFYKNALVFCTSSIYARYYITTLDNIGLGFLNIQQFDSALFYQKKSLILLEQLNDSTLLAESYLNIGSTLLDLKKFKEAEIYFKKAHEINLTLKNDYAIQLSNLHLGKVYLSIGDYKKAQPYLEKSLALAKQLKISNKIQNAALSLTDLYNMLGEYKKSSFLYKELVDLMAEDAIEENTKAINELSAKYETEKKQKEIQLLTQDKQLKENIIQKDKYVKVFVGSIAILLLLLSLIFIFRFKEKKKDNNLLIEKNEAIALQNKEIELQKTYIQQKNTEITDSIMYAKRIQASVLPSNSLLKKLLPNSFLYFKPKDIISGDFYWIAENHHYIYFAVADCTGHGVPGAMMSMLGASLLNQIIINSKVESPNDILKELHFSVVKTLNENMQNHNSKDGMDIALIRIDTKNKKILYAGAGRHLYVIKNNELKIFKPDKYSIGGIFDANTINFTLHEIECNIPTQLYLFSDGVPDQFGGPFGKKLMVKQLQEILISSSNFSINEQEEFFKHKFEQWKLDIEQTDDVTLAAIRL